MTSDALDCVIAAVSSPGGRSPRGLVRASGESLHEIVSTITSGEASDLLRKRRRGVAGGSITASIAGSEISVPCLLLSLPSPGSFTGQDMIEIELPGNPHLLAAVETAILNTANRAQHSARPAGPGEFSARAFLAGRIGLLEAEGVAALIAARNDVELIAAHHLQSNPLAATSRELAGILTRVLGLIEAGIDFTDSDGVIAMTVGTLREELGEVLQRLDVELSHSQGSEATYGLPSVALVGPPNAGKSTLFNALLGHSRMIVSDRAGTTRDTPAERCRLLNREIILLDTAGINRPSEPASEIDRKAQMATERALRSSDLLLLLRPHDEKEGHVPPSDSGWDGYRVLEVASRIDLAPKRPIPEGVVGVSAICGTGIDALRAAIEDRLNAGTSASVESALRLLPRHRAALNTARDALAAALETIQTDDAEKGPRRAEVLAEHVRIALNGIAALEGGGDPEDVLGVVFSSFCVGK